MQEVTQRRDIDVVLTDLEQTLRDERSHLLALDAASIDALNPRKEGLEKELLAIAPSELLKHRSRLELIRRQLQENLVLLVHARDNVQHRLGIEAPPVVNSRPSSPIAAGVRLNVRG